jgi:hypothetical protein
MISSTPEFFKEKLSGGGLFHILMLCKVRDVKNECLPDCVLGNGLTLYRVSHGSGYRDCTKGPYISCFVYNRPPTESGVEELQELFMSLSAILIAHFMSAKGLFF